MIPTTPDVTFSIILSYAAAGVLLFGLLGWTWRTRQRLRRALEPS